MVRFVRLVPVVAALVMAAPSSPRAVSIPNAAMEWNQIALTATVTAGQGPLPQARSMTLVQVAVHDAVNSITRKHGTYGAYGPAPSGASPEAAAISAAHTMLMSLFSSQSGTFNPARAASLAARGLTESDPGIPVGQNIAAALF